MGDQISGVDYTEADHKLWGYVYNKLRPSFMKHGCKEYLNSFAKLEGSGLFQDRKIP